VHARPDIQAAQARLQSALSSAVAAKLDFLPSVQITGRYADNQLRERDIFSRVSDALDRSLGVSLTQSLFQGGRVHAASKAASSRAQIAAAELRQALLNAAFELDSALATQRSSAIQQERLNLAKQSSDQSAAMAAARLKAGIDSELTFLSFKREQLERTRALLDADTARCQAHIDLQAAVTQDPTQMLSAQ
jgi:outer membrane protein TolC